MKKILSYFFILVGTGLLVISSSGNIMRAIKRKRNAINGPLGIHRSKGGDLATISYLDNMPQFIAQADFTCERQTDTANRNIDLYVYADSYVIYIPDSAFGHINKFTLGRWDFTDMMYRLDKRKKNILLIENAERFVRTRFREPSIFDHVKDSAEYIVPQQPVSHNIHIPYIRMEDLYNPAINQNLEYNLFNYNFLNGVRQLKAALNYHWFERASGDVALSNNRDFLFLKKTVDAHGPSSVYEEVIPEELNKLLGNINAIYQHYRRQGFDEVYFSIIPNPATILQPTGYNGLIPAIEQGIHAANIPFITVYDSFKNDPNPASLYRIGDSHWNNEGRQLWIQAVNEMLAKESRTWLKQ